jgi:protein TonB
MNVKIVSGGVSGIALPSPPVTTENAAANESKGFYKSEPSPAPPPEPENAVKIPEKAAPVPKKTAAAPKNAPAPKTPPPPPPTNAVPYGQGGNPNVGYGQFSTQSGPVGAGFGDGAFGNKYGEYVQGMIRRISQNWLKGLVDSHITRAPKVFISFVVGRDGKISNVSVQQSSGIPSLDNSAMRAVYASNPLQPLPRDYSGSTVNVSFYFEYIK